MQTNKSFNFKGGRKIAGKYEIVERLGEGWEGEVYLVRELSTGIERAAKFFYPTRNKGNRRLKNYALKLHKLRHCPIVIQYHTQETMDYDGEALTFLTSEYVEGELLSRFVKDEPGGRLSVFEGLHLLRALASGIADIHRLKEYHGDIHPENIIIERRGLGFEVKLVDVFRWSNATKPEVIGDDIVDMIRVFYDAVGGSKWYGKLGQEVRDICMGLKRSLILRKFRTAEKLIYHLDNLEWE